MKATHEWASSPDQGMTAVRCRLCATIVNEADVINRLPIPDCIDLPEPVPPDMPEPLFTAQSRNDRDGFMKMAIVAFAANMAAHHRDTPAAGIINKASQLAELSWQALQLHRAQWAAAESESEAKREP